MNPYTREARAARLIDAPPTAAVPRPRRSWLSLLLLLLARTAWAYRVELTAAAATMLTWQLLTDRLSRAAAAALLSAGLLALILTPPSRRWLTQILWNSHLRRRWDLACRHALLTTPEDRVPTLSHCKPVPAGDRGVALIPPGLRVAYLEQAAEIIAAFLRVRDVRVTRDPNDAGRAEVVIARRDPLAEPFTQPWPNVYADRLDLWEPIPVGVDEHGEPVTVSLPERNVLIGGEPGAGKSVAQSALVASAALDPNARLVRLDGKWVELSCWARIADRFVGPSATEAIEALTELRDEMDQRYQRLLAEGRRKLVRAHGADDDRLVVVVIDELALYLNSGDRKLDQQFAGVLRDLVSRGRAAGIIVVAATQKSGSDVIPTSIRDLVAFRWAFRCSTPDAFATILGRGIATAGYSAERIDPAQRGVGWLRAEGDRPGRLRTYHLTDDNLAELAERAEYMRSGRVTVELRRLDHGLTSRG